jgi:hypothetical protein
LPAILGLIVALSALPAAGTVISSLASVEFAAAAAAILPNPIAAGLLATAIGAALTAADNLIDEAEGNEPSPTTTSAAQTETSTSTSTSSSAFPTATEYLVALNSKWPDAVIDSFLEAFPENGTRYDYSALKLDTFITEMSEDLAESLALLPVFTYIVPNGVPQIEFDDPNMDDGMADPGKLRARRAEPDNPDLSKPSSDGNAFDNGTESSSSSLVRRRPGTQFPFIPDLTVFGQQNAPDHLVRLSYKAGMYGYSTQYLHEGSQSGSRVNVYVMDSGLGRLNVPVSQLTAGSLDSVGRRPLSAYLGAASGGMLN